MENNFIIVFIVAGVGIIGWLGYLTYRFFAFLKEREELLKKARGKNLEKVLEDSINRSQKNSDEIKKIQQAIDELGKIAMISITKVGVLRFNPFNDTGGDQSFAIALLNAQNSGVVVSSLHGREGTRIYAKPVQKGESEHHLTDEELKAIERARKQ